MKKSILNLLALIVIAAVSGCAPPDAPQSYDLLIVNGTVYDGSARAAEQRNIGIVGERIVALNADAQAPGPSLVDLGRPGGQVVGRCEYATGVGEHGPGLVAQHPPDL